MIKAVEVNEESKTEAKPEIKYESSNKEVFFRFAVEEILRRGLPRTAERLTTNEIYGLLYGDGMPAFREGIKHKRIEEERKKNTPEDSKSAYSKYDERAAVFRNAHEKAL